MFPLLVDSPYRNETRPSGVTAKMEDTKGLTESRGGVAASKGATHIRVR